MADTSLPADPTLDEVRETLAPLVARNAAFDGWSQGAVDMAAQQAGVDQALARLAFDGGAMAMIDAWIGHIDAQMLVACPPEKLAQMKVNEKITALVEARLALVKPDREALRRALAIFAMPQNIARSARISWRSADVMWRAAGDTATDYNHYSKRAILAGVYSATLLSFVNDDSEDYGETRAFLTRRIQGILKFEKAKSRVTASAERRPSLARFIGRLRYRTR